MRRTARSAALALFAAFLLLGTTGQALAHDHLMRMTPGVDSSNGQLPPAVLLMFDDAVASIGASLVVVAPSGVTISEARPVVAGSTIRVALKRGTVSENGSYAVRFRIMSVDGHEVHGTEAFSVGVGGLVAPVAPAAPASAQPGGGHTLAVVAGFVVLVLGGLIGAAALRRGQRTRDRIDDEEI